MTICAGSHGGEDQHQWLLGRRSARLSDDERMTKAMVADGSVSGSPVAWHTLGMPFDRIGQLKP
jgi:hypothetical protein